MQNVESKKQRTWRLAASFDLASLLLPARRTKSRGINCLPGFYGLSRSCHTGLVPFTSGLSPRSYTSISPSTAFGLTPPHFPFIVFIHLGTCMSPVSLPSALPNILSRFGHRPSAIAMYRTASPMFHRWSLPMFRSSLVYKLRLFLACPLARKSTKEHDTFLIPFAHSLISFLGLGA